MDEARPLAIAMTLENWAYAGMLGFCLAATIPLAWWYRLTVFRQWRRLAATVAIAGTPFLVWDLVVTHVGHWWFDDAQTLPPRIAGLPLEEISFFIVIPIVTILTFETVGVVHRTGLRRPPVEVSAASASRSSVPQERE